MSLQIFSWDTYVCMVARYSNYKKSPGHEDFNLRVLDNLNVPFEMHMTGLLWKQKVWNRLNSQIGQIFWKIIERDRVNQKIELK